MRCTAVVYNLQPTMTEFTHMGARQKVLSVALDYGIRDVMFC